ncbi:hypothetical protein SPKIRA_27030 [Sphingomonas paucimobilis]|nr:hypothetical protein SPKIRA_27030 [Sphingomonas paucimobilis]
MVEKLPPPASAFIAPPTKPPAAASARKVQSIIGRGNAWCGAQVPHRRPWFKRDATFLPGTGRGTMRSMVEGDRR